VRMQSGRRQSHQDVSDLDGFARNDAILLNHSDDESREIVFARWIEPGHFGRFAADQCATVVLASLRNASHDLLGRLELKLADSQVVHEEQRGRALNGDVVDAMIDEVAAYGVMKVHLEGDLQLGPNTIYAGNKYRILELLLVYFKESAETADLA